LAQAQRLRPHVMLVDTSIVRMDVIRELRARLPQLKIIALLTPGGVGYDMLTLTVGADASISKPEVSAELLPAIRRVMGKQVAWQAA
jgi:DNA-binding NarL/FixJ family response regulator